MCPMSFLAAHPKPTANSPPIPIPAPLIPPQTPTVPPISQKARITPPPRSLQYKKYEKGSSGSSDPALDSAAPRTSLSPFRYTPPSPPPPQTVSPHKQPTTRPAFPNSLENLPPPPHLSACKSPQTHFRLRKSSIPTWQIHSGRQFINGCRQDLA